MMDPADELEGLAASAAAAAAGAGLPHRRRSRLSASWRALRRAPLTAWFGLIVIAAYLIIAVFAPWVAPFLRYEKADILWCAVRRQYLIQTTRLLHRL